MSRQVCYLSGNRSIPKGKACITSPFNRTGGVGSAYYVFCGEICATSAFAYVAAVSSIVTNGGAVYMEGGRRGPGIYALKGNGGSGWRWVSYTPLRSSTITTRPAPMPQGKNHLGGGPALGDPLLQKERVCDKCQKMELPSTWRQATCAMCQARDLLISWAQQTGQKTSINPVDYIVCICDRFDLSRYGCKCGAMKVERAIKQFKGG